MARYHESSTAESVRRKIGRTARTVQAVRERKMNSGMTVLMDAPFGGGMMHGGYGGGFFLGGLLTAFWAALIVLLVLWIVRNWSTISAATRRAAASVQTGSPGASSVQTPLEIVQTRYAKGEISREEYEAIRRDLLGEAPPTQA
jgi:putative membrane protein